ncbi:MAG: type II secretion system protein [Armatimonadota bacterium]
MVACRRRAAVTRSACPDAGRIRSGARVGFTLTELLVVIGIAALLLGLMIPTGTSLREGNRALSCKTQLQAIGQALRMYAADEGGVPPFYIDAAEDTNATPHGPGLMALYDLGYLNRRESLHCPRDVYASPDSAEYLLSYQRKDEDVAATTELNKYSYLSSRGVTDPTDPYYRRQLQPAADVGGVSPVPTIVPGWRPADDTVVTWCPFHTDYLQVGGVGEYQVLFWDGSVVRIPEDVMADPTVGPAEAWQVSRADGM